MGSNEVVTINWWGLTLLFDSSMYPTILKYGYTVISNADGRYSVVGTSKEYNKNYLSRLLLNCPQDMLVDHINGNTLDNRLCNLRVVTRQQNCFNSDRKNKKSGLPKGVSFVKTRNKYNAKIQIHYTSYNLGNFNTVEEAEAAYKKAAEKYFVEHAFHISRKDTK